MKMADEGIGNGSAFNAIIVFDCRSLSLGQCILTDRHNRQSSCRPPRILGATSACKKDLRISAGLSGDKIAGSHVIVHNKLNSSCLKG